MPKKDYFRFRPLLAAFDPEQLQQARELVFRLHRLGEGRRPVELAHHHDALDLAAFEGSKKLRIILERDAAIRLAVRPQHIGMRQDAGAAIHVAVADRGQADRLDAVEQLLAHGQAIGVGGRRAMHAHMHVARIVHLGAEARMRLEPLAIGHVHHPRGDVVDRGLEEIVFRIDAEVIERRQRRKLRPPPRQRRHVGGEGGLAELVRLEARRAGIIGRREHEPLGRNDRIRIGERAAIGLEGAGIEGGEFEQRGTIFLVDIGLDLGRQVVGQRLVRHHLAEQPVAHAVRIGLGVERQVGAGGKRLRQPRAGDADRDRHDGDRHGDEGAAETEPRQQAPGPRRLSRKRHMQWIADRVPAHADRQSPIPPN